MLLLNPRFLFTIHRIQNWTIECMKNLLNLPIDRSTHWLIAGVCITFKLLIVIPFPTRECQKKTTTKVISICFGCRFIMKYSHFSLSLLFSLFLIRFELFSVPFANIQPITNNLSIANGKEKMKSYFDTIFWSKTSGNDCTFQANKYFQTIKIQNHGSFFLLSFMLCQWNQFNIFFMMKMIPPLRDRSYWFYVKRKQTSSVETLHFHINLQKLRLLFQILILFFQTASSLPIIKYVCSNCDC